MNKFLWIGILAVTWPGGMTAQPLDTTFSPVGPPTPKVPPPGVGIYEMNVQSPGQETGEGEARDSAFPEMVVGATLGSLAGTATGVLTVAAFCQDDCNLDDFIAAIATGWAGGTAGSAIGAWIAGNEDGLSGGDAVLASLVGGAAGILADVGWGFPVVQGITTATVAELLRE